MKYSQFAPRAWGALFGVLVLALALTACGGAGRALQITSAQAATADCSGPEQFAHGTVQADMSTVYETSTYLLYASPVCRSNGYTMTVKYTLQYQHTVQLVDMQMGSGMSRYFHPGADSSSGVPYMSQLNPENFEWAWWAQFDTPDGRHYEFFQQFDKHSDYRGNQNVKIPLVHGLVLPAGTVVTLYRPPSAGEDGATQTHITGQKVELIGY